MRDEQRQKSLDKRVEVGNRGRDSEFSIFLRLKERVKERVKEKEYGDTTVGEILMIKEKMERKCRESKLDTHLI